MVAGQDRLQGWKEIAAYLDRDERTVKRWEKQRGMPVRRIPGGGRANVYCLTPELQAWFATGGTRVSASEPKAEQEIAAQASAASSAAIVTGALSPDEREMGAPEEPVDEVDEELAEADLRPEMLPGGRSWMTVRAAALVCAVVLCGLLMRYSGEADARAGSRPRSETAKAVDRRVEADAHERYLEGVYFFEQRTPGSLAKARAAFEAEIAKDPQCAMAYAGLANTFLLLREYSTMTSEEAYGRAQAAAEHALGLDPNLADAHAALGFLLFFHSLEAGPAEREFETALRLEPNSAHAHHWYGSMLMHESRFDEAMEQLRMAQSLEPASPAILATKAYNLGLSGRRDEAIEMLRMLDMRGEGSASVHFMMAQLSLMAPRDVRQYLAEMERHAALKGDVQELSAFSRAAAGYRRAGERGMWSEVLLWERQHPGADQQPTFRAAESEAALGEDEQALRDLSNLAERRVPQMTGVELDPLFAGLRREEGFEQVRARMRGVLAAEAGVERGSLSRGFRSQVRSR